MSGIDPTADDVITINPAALVAFIEQQVRRLVEEYAGAKVQEELMVLQPLELALERLVHVIDQQRTDLDRLKQAVANIDGRMADAEGL